MAFKNTHNSIFGNNPDNHFVGVQRLAVDSLDIWTATTQMEKGRPNDGNNQKSHTVTILEEKPQ